MHALSLITQRSRTPSRLARRFELAAARDSPLGRQIIAQAKAQGDQLLTDAENELDRLQAAAQRELGELTKQKESISSYLAPIRQLLRTQLSPVGEPPPGDCLAGSGYMAPALIALAGTMAWTGDFDEAGRWLQRAEQVLRADTGPDIRLLVHVVSGMLQAGRGHHHKALQEFGAAEYLGSQLADSHALASQVTGWMVATQTRLGRCGEARALLAAVDDERASSGEIRNALAVICLAEGDPARAIGALRDVLDGMAPVLGYVTVVEAQLLAGLAHCQLGDQRAANQAVERALALAEPDRQPSCPSRRTPSARTSATSTPSCRSVTAPRQYTAPVHCGSSQPAAHTSATRSPRLQA